MVSEESNEEAPVEVPTDSFIYRSKYKENEFGQLVENDHCEEEEYIIDSLYQLF